MQGFGSPALPKAKTFVFLSIPIALDAAVNLLGVWTSPDWVRFLTGIVWGLILPFYYLAGLSDFFLNRKKGLTNLS